MADICQALSDRFTVYGYITPEIPLQRYRQATKKEGAEALKGIAFLRSVGLDMNEWLLVQGFKELSFSVEVCTSCGGRRRGDCSVMHRGSSMEDIDRSFLSLFFLPAL